MKMKPGAYFSYAMKSVVIIARTREHGYWFATNGFWYDELGRKANPLKVGEPRQHRENGPPKRFDLKLETHKPISKSLIDSYTSLKEQNARSNQKDSKASGKGKKNRVHNASKQK